MGLLHENKGEVFEIFRKFHVSVEMETSKLLKFLRTDSGGEYCSGAFKDYCNKFGIKNEKIVPGTPQWNGVAGRMNHTTWRRSRVCCQILVWKSTFRQKL